MHLINHITVSFGEFRDVILNTPDFFFFLVEACPLLIKVVVICLNLDYHITATLISGPDATISTKYIIPFISAFEPGEFTILF